MTYSDEVNSTQGEDFFEEESEYPVAFGITFTPPVSGVAVGLLGLVAAIYIIMTFFMPAWTEYNTLKEDRDTKQAQIEQRKSGKLDQKMIEMQRELQKSQATRNKVLSLFSNENSLKTILLDINRFVGARQLQLNSFKPTSEITVVSDGSLGEAVNNRLKSQSFALEIEGDFNKTQELIQDIERLQPLLIIKGLSSELVEKVQLVDIKQTGGTIIETGEAVPVGTDDLKTTFTLDAILPLNPEEIAELNPPPAEDEAAENQNGQP
ncbi:MAG TPA: pilus assembly protein [Cyanothece sp. UBA12306]|nr:pilus assembly protein [Cyanothece sp. UBA12306]